MTAAEAIERQTAAIKRAVMQHQLTTAQGSRLITLVINELSNNTNDDERHEADELLRLMGVGAPVDRITGKALYDAKQSAS